jgi:DNA polymerase (family X)
MTASNKDIARALDRVGSLIELRGDNPYKVRAYRTAVAQIENLGEELAAIHAREELRQIPGFGDAIATKVEELLTTGRLHLLEELEAEVPETLLEVRGLAGVGPKTANLLWKEAGIETVEQLELAARSGKLAGLPRMGAKTVDNIVRALDARERGMGPKTARQRERVVPLVERLLDQLRDLPDARRVEVAGSYRRGRETVGDLDFLVATTEPVAVLHAFTALPLVERVSAQGPTKSSVEMDGGLQVDCRAVPLESFGAAWQYFTGSKAHNVRLRGRALRRGLMLNEYGVYRLEGGERVAGQSEEEVYRTLGLRWIAPERREDRGEIEAAQLEPEQAASARGAHPPGVEGF